MCAYFLLVFAGLVRDRARGLASGLAGRLALAAIDFLVFGGRFHFIDRFHVFHQYGSPSCFFINIIPQH